MLTMSRRRAHVKPVRKSPRPAAPFAEGLLDPEPDVPPCDFVPAPPGTSQVPTIRGAGLTLEERFYVTGRRNTARSIIAQDLPDATPGELDAMADRAAQDALREVLRTRPAAADVACCPAVEPVPCVTCSTPTASERRSGTDVEDEDGDEDWGDASTWPAWTDEVHWELGPKPKAEPKSDPVQVRVPLADFISGQVEHFRKLNTHAGDLLALSLEGLLDAAKFTQARTPQELAARIEVMERDDASDHWRPAVERLPSGCFA